MSSPVQWFSTADTQVKWLRAVLVTAALFGMLLSLPLWLATREYPLVPIIGGWPSLPAACGPVLLGFTLLSLVASARFFRPAIIAFLAATLYLYCCDQNRGQPWIYLYWVLLLLNLLPERVSVAACRLALCVAYVWAGIQKLNPTFSRVIPAWFVQPAVGWGWPSGVVGILHAGVASTPYLEIFIGVGVWFSKTRWPAIAVAAVIHVMAMVFLGFQPNNLNLVVWPWNIAMIASLVVLFGSKEAVSLSHSFRDLRPSIPGMVLTGLFAFLPALSFFGWWDSYFSWALYSANLARADVYINQSVRDRLPDRLKSYVHPVESFNPSFQLPFTFEHPRWGAAEMHVPPLPEPRGYLVMFRQISKYAVDTADCWMIVQTRTGKVLLYRPGATHPVVLAQ